ncbi:hypothetical protein HNY73_009506 [Argiope bruennichi]|uniref:Uncharacterized protein n=1 Tax=Argiope bruennichi TaxID=94029 RepID=A0A8T0FAS0_ARGBR|nr:hypothetical protein HNY73_009506 [Argiope bruennichi]
MSSGMGGGRINWRGGAVGGSGGSMDESRRPFARGGGMNGNIEGLSNGMGGLNNGMEGMRIIYTSVLPML